MSVMQNVFTASLRYLCIQRLRLFRLDNGRSLVALRQVELRSILPVLIAASSPGTAVEHLANGRLLTRVFNPDL